MCNYTNTIKTHEDHFLQKKAVFSEFSLSKLEPCGISRNAKQSQPSLHQPHNKRHNTQQKQQQQQQQQQRRRKNPSIGYNGRP
jgi:hypothetical protein